MKEKLSHLRVGRPAPAALATVAVKAYGSFVELKSIGNVSVHSTHSLAVMVHDPSLLGAVQTALTASPLVGDDGGVSAANNGLVVKFAQPTTDARKQMAKMVSARGEDAKVAVRKVRNAAVDALKKAKPTDDLKRQLQDQIDALTKEFEAEIKKVCTEKEKSILTA
jgi:ribosome recycling factor